MKLEEKNKIQIKSNLFDLTKEQEELSKSMYNGKIIKCLVAPYHSYNQLEGVVTYTQTTYLFPERECSSSQIIGLISMICNSPSKEEFRIITTNMNVITDMIDDCVRVLTENGDVVPSSCKTFAANIHSIRHQILENKNHKTSEEEKNKSHEKINKLIKKINDSSKINHKDSLKMLEEIELIGEPLISKKLKEMVLEKSEY